MNNISTPTLFVLYFLWCRPLSDYHCPFVTLIIFFAFLWPGILLSVSNWTQSRSEIISEMEASASLRSARQAIERSWTDGTLKGVFSSALIVGVKDKHESSLAMSFVFFHGTVIIFNLKWVLTKYTGFSQILSHSRSFKCLFNKLPAMDGLPRLQFPQYRR